MSERAVMLIALAVLVVILARELLRTPTTVELARMYGLDEDPEEDECPL